MKPDLTSLDRLHDIIMPSPAPWLPPASGWFWVAGYVAIVAAVLVFRSLVRWQRNRYRREALAELSQQEAALFHLPSRAAALASVATLLKRTALSAWPRPDVAALTGPSWLAFLNRTGNTTEFSQSPGAILEQATYDPRLAHSLDEPALRKLITLARHWIAHHQRDPAEC